MAKRQMTTLGVVHVTATPEGRDVQLADIDRVHRALGWNGPGYNRLILLNGTRITARGYDEVGAHVAGYNSTAIGVALVGGLGAGGKPAHTATREQMAALEAELRDYAERYPGIGFCGHRDLSPDRNGNGIIEPGEHIKACPCFDVIPWVESLGLKGANIRGTWNEIYDVPAANGGRTKVAGPDARNVYLQKLLSLTGAQFGPIDGIIGDKTQAALKSFQGTHKLHPSGVFDPETVKRLRTMFE